MMRSITKTSFNDMLNKGFDSTRQEIWLFKQYEAGEPCYQWVPEVYERHGHSWDIDGMERDEKGRFTSTPPGVMTEKKPNVVWRGCQGTLRSLTKLGNSYV
jgi:hypothetical protein